MTSTRSRTLSREFPSDSVPLLATSHVRLVSEANSREHWATKARRVKAHRDGAYFVLAATKVNGAVWLRKAGALMVTLTRIAPRRLDDDNLTSACKATRDGVADWLQTDDRDEHVTWRYGQRSAGAKVYAVEIRIESGACYLWREARGH